MKKIFIVFVVVCTPSYWPARANAVMDHLLTSYMVAKADTNRVGMTPQEIKKYPYTVQVASYLNEGDAVSHVNELRSEKLKDVRYFPTFVRGEVWYKVAVGKFTRRSDANMLKNQLSGKYNEPFAVVISLLERPSADESYDREPSATEAPDAVAPSEAVPNNATAAENSPEQATSKPQIKLIPLTKNFARKVRGASGAVVHEVAAKTPARDHYYALQVGAFPTQKLAAKKMVKLGLKDVSQATGVVSGKTWHRVLVGHFATKKLALAYQDSKGDLLKGAFVRRIMVHEP